MGSLALLTTLSSQDKESVLSLVTDYKAGLVFGGNQLGDIHVWSLHTYFPVTRLIGHQSSVLCLAISVERSLLFSSSGDNTVRIWDTSCFGNALYIVKPPIDSCGDVLSLVWCNQLNRLYLGCQDASIQWISLPAPKAACKAPNRERKVTEPCSSSRLCCSSKTLARTRSSVSASEHSKTNGILSSISMTKEYHSVTLSPPLLSPHPPSGRSLHHKFFDSLSQADLLKAARRRDIHHSHSPLLHHLMLDGMLGSPPKDGDAPDETSSISSNLQEGGSEVLFIDNRDSVTYAHFGYIYCLLLVYLNDRPMLISGSGDSTIKIWTLDPQTGALTPHCKPLSATSSASLSSATPTQPCEDLGAVLTLAAYGSTLYSGYQDGVIKIWDLDTFTCIRTLFHRGSVETLSGPCSSGVDDILTMTVLDNGEMFSGCASGVVIRWDSSFQRVKKWKSHEGSALASCFILHQGKRLLLTGGSDNCIKVWDVYHTEETVPRLVSGDSDSKDQAGTGMAFQDRMFRHLSQFVSYRSISNEENREDCRQAALYLKRTLIKLGADARLLPGEPGRNPLVLATFKGKSSSDLPVGGRRRRVLYYGHYDVVQAGDSKDWKAPAFVMTGHNGWLYGRGVSDNKGPTLAVAYAVTALLDQRSLDVDVVMLVEGEEEAGSAGFQKAVKDNKELIGEIDVVLVSNSYWLGDETPCMTFGLRGVIHATVKVTSTQPDLHSGMHGGAVHEPVLDLVRVLSALVSADGQIQLDRFYSDVRPLDEEESKLYDQIVEHLAGAENINLLKHSPISDLREILLAKWRQPALSIHKIDVTGPAHATVIPASAQSAVSIRIVPDQSLDEIAASLVSFLETAFHGLKSSNTLQVEINHTADWWLGDPNSAYSSIIAECVEAEWGTKPLWIREGGSIPSIPFLENEFSAKAIHLPMGSASDSAHLPNERIKMINLEKGNNIVAKFLKKVAAI